MSAKVFFIPVKAGEAVKHVARKSIRIFQETGLDGVFDKGQLVAVKQHFGEHADGYFIKPPVTAGLVRAIKDRGAQPFLTETSTLYVGNRCDGVRHAATVAAHGFTAEAIGAPFIPADGLRGIESVAVPVAGTHFKEVHIAAGAYHADAALILTHVTGHCQAGYGGAIKNIAMGLVPRSAKMIQHFQAIPRQDHYKCIACGACVRWCPGGAIEMVEGADRRYAKIDEKKCIGCGECLAFCHAGAMDFEWSKSGPTFVERMVEHALGFVSIKRDRTVYINYAVEITRDCDCMDTNKPVLGAVGIFASTDLLACEQATVDAINQQTGKDYFAQLWTGYDYKHQLAYAEKVGLGSREYTLTTLS